MLAFQAKTAQLDPSRVAQFTEPSHGLFNIRGPHLECSGYSHELPMCVRWPMRMGMCVRARVRRKYLT